MEDVNDFDTVEDELENEEQLTEGGLSSTGESSEATDVVHQKDVRVDIVDKEMTLVSDLLSDKFPQDFCILVRYGDYSRQDLITAVVERLKGLAEGADKSKLNSFIGWLCKTLNLDPGVFNDLSVLKKELSLAQQNIESIFEGVPQEVVFEEELKELDSEE